MRRWKYLRAVRINNNYIVSIGTRVISIHRVIICILWCTTDCYRNYCLQQNIRTIRCELRIFGWILFMRYCSDGRRWYFYTRFHQRSPGISREPNSKMFSWIMYPHYRRNGFCRQSLDWKTVEVRKWNMSKTLGIEFILRRSCRDLNTIYLVVRPLDGRNPNERVKEMFISPVINWFYNFLLGGFTS